MKLGIKVGLKNDSIADLHTTGARACEVWFDARRPDDYQELFERLQGLKIDVGLHFWGALPDDTWTNLAYPDDAVIDQTMAMMRQTIDLATKYHFRYVNIHPGAQAKVKIDFTKETFTLLSEPVELAESEQLFLDNAQQLSAYAASHNVTFTIETVPPRVIAGAADSKSRTSAHNIYELPVSTIIHASSLGLAIANDFGHTAADTLDAPIDVARRFLTDTTKILAASTRLIHLGFLMPPFNGTDNHDMLNNPVLDTEGAVPNRNQLFDLFNLFQNRPDVWVITEPASDHVSNYFWAQKILTDAGVDFE